MCKKMDSEGENGQIQTNRISLYIFTLDVLYNTSDR